MLIDWANFTPISALLGGVIIGLAAAMLVLLNGRIAGISGIVGGLLKPKPGDITWRILFVAGLVSAPLLYGLFNVLPPIIIKADFPMLIAAGLLVGVSTRYASGCTSGHGVCGLSRLSPRSLAATLTFMGGGFASVYIIRHVAGA